MKKAFYVPAGAQEGMRAAVDHTSQVVYVMCDDIAPIVYRV